MINQNFSAHDQQLSIKNFADQDQSKSIEKDDATARIGPEKNKGGGGCCCLRGSCCCLRAAANRGREKETASSRGIQSCFSAAGMAL